MKNAAYKPSRRKKLRFNAEMEELFESSRTDGIASKFELSEQQINVETVYGSLECRGNLQRAADALDAFFRSLFYEANEREIEAFEARTRWQDDYLSDEGLQSFLTRSRKDRQLLMPYALKLFEQQLPHAIKEAVEALVMSTREQTLRELDGQTSLPSVDTQAMREHMAQASKRMMRARSNSPGRGRPNGSKAVKSKENAQSERLKFEEAIVRAMMKLYPADNNKKPLRKMIAKELGVSMRTLTRKTKPGVGKSFAKLVEIAEMRQRN